jgi:hypothetical protein
LNEGTQVELRRDRNSRPVQQLERLTLGLHFLLDPRPVRYVPKTPYPSYVSLADRLNA